MKFIDLDYKVKYAVCLRLQLAYPEHDRLDLWDSCILDTETEFGASGAVLGAFGVIGQHLAIIGDKHEYI